MDGWMEYPTGSLLCVHGVISLPCSSSFSLICISRDWRLHRLVPPSFPSFLPCLFLFLPRGLAQSSSSRFFLGEECKLSSREEKSSPQDASLASDEEASSKAAPGGGGGEGEGKHANQKLAHKRFTNMNLWIDLSTPSLSFACFLPSRCGLQLVLFKLSAGEGQRRLLLVVSLERQTDRQTESRRA